MENDKDSKKQLVRLSAWCDPSLKMQFLGRLREAGLGSETDAIRQLVRDFVARRINYTAGILQSQHKIA